jgi:cardiolipin synthase
MGIVFEHWLFVIAVVVVELAVLARIMLRPNRDPTSRLAWLFVVGAFPLLGIFAYCCLVKSALADAA